MLVVAFVQWWYGPGWRDAAARLRTHLHRTYLTFSVPILLRTMFMPWRRIITTPGASIEDRFRAHIDNLISRGIGFVVRLFALGAAALIMAGYAIFGGLWLLLWPLAPLLGPILIVSGLL